MILTKKQAISILNKITTRRILTLAAYDLKLIDDCDKNTISLDDIISALETIETNKACN